MRKKRRTGHHPRWLEIVTNDDIRWREKRRGKTKKFTFCESL